MLKELKALDNLKEVYLAIDGMEMRVDVAASEVVGESKASMLEVYLADRSGPEIGVFGAEPIPHAESDLKVKQVISE